MFDNLAMASILLSRLDAQGIDAAMLDAEIVSMDPLMSPAIGGVKVAVRRMDEARVLAVVREGKESAEEEAASPHEQEGKARGERGRRCPHCNSTKTFKEKISGRAAALSILLLGFPLLIWHRGWKCAKCFKGFG